MSILNSLNILNILNINRTDLNLLLDSKPGWIELFLPYTDLWNFPNFAVLGELRTEIFVTD